jgi:hypothetical protein
MIAKRFVEAASLDFVTTVTIVPRTTNNGTKAKTFFIRAELKPNAPMLKEVLERPFIDNDEGTIKSYTDLTKLYDFITETRHVVTRKKSITYPKGLGWKGNIAFAPVADLGDFNIPSDTTIVDEDDLI